MVWVQLRHLSILSSVDLLHYSQYCPVQHNTANTGMHTTKLEHVRSRAHNQVIFQQRTFRAARIPIAFIESMTPAFLDR